MPKIEQPIYQLRWTGHLGETYCNGEGFVKENRLYRQPEDLRFRVLVELVIYYPALINEPIVLPLKSGI